MKKLLLCLLTAALLTGTALTVEAAKQIAFGKGKSSASVSGKVQGSNDVDYVIRASAGQTMTVDLKPVKARLISMYYHQVARVKPFLSVQVRAIILKPHYLAMGITPFVCI